MIERWQPIETAPKDKEVNILIFCSFCGHDFMFVAHRTDPRYNDPPNTYTDDDGLYHPTHWMSLPEKPATAPEIADQREEKL